MKKVLIVLLVLLVLSSTALAGDNAVSLETSSVEDGTVEVSVETEIELVFTNNVVNKKVADNNRESISLSTGGQDVAIEIIMADDQIEPDKKRIISVVPESSLLEGTQYTLTINKNLSGKNGNIIGEDVVISFTTEGKIARGFNWWWIIAIGAVVIVTAVVLIFVKKKNAKVA